MTKDLTEIVHAWVREDLDTGAKLSIGYYGPALIERLKPIQELIQRLEGEMDEARAFVRGDLQADLVEQGARISAASEWKAKAISAEQALSASQQEVERLTEALKRARTSINEDAAAGWRVRAVADIDSALQTGGKEHG